MIRFNKKFFLFTLLACSNALATSYTATLSPTQGNQASGTIIFVPHNPGVEVRVDMSGLTPGKHGLHIHERGDCSAPDASSAGGHYNPNNNSHGGPEAHMRHEGDLGNLTADNNGKAHYTFEDKTTSLTSDHSIVGKSVIVHADPDDLVSQPAGNSGTRLACGVIQPSKQ